MPSSVSDDRGSIVLPSDTGNRSFEAREILKDNKSDVVDANAAKILIDNWFNINK